MVDLTGAADLHCHFGPSPHFDRSVDAVTAAREAAAAGHAAVVLKSHDEPTAGIAHAVQAAVGDELRVFGGVCCDREVGGINPAAVEVTLRLGGKLVWLPTLSSRQDQENGIGAALGIPGPGLVVADDDGALLPDTHAVLDLVAEHDAVLATGHVSAREHVAVARAFGRRGRLLVTHAREELAGPNLSRDQCVELADLGAVIELCALTCIGALATRSVEEMVATARAVGIERCTIATDYGQAANPHPAEGFQQFGDALVDAGLTETEVRTMACTNPAQLLGLA